jgi:acetoin utilization protein AcuB
MKVREAMSTDPRVIGPDASVRAALALMRDNGIRHLPVVGPAGQLLGLLSDQDLKHAAFLPAVSEHVGWPPSRLRPLRVRDVMTWSVVTTHPDAPLRDVALTIFQRRIGCLPVLEEGRLVGIITERDLFLTALSEKWMDIDVHEFPW